MQAADLSSLAMIRALVGFDTTSRESNLGLIEFVRDHLRRLGVESLLVYDRAQPKANLYATLGRTDRPGIMLSGHTDVVPVDGQDWNSHPFTLEERDGRLYGRGTADMKSFIAVALALAPEILARDPRTPIHLALSYDEEVGCVGVHRLVDRLNEMPVHPAMCIVGEPTDMQVVIGHKGGRGYRVDVRGAEAHSSLAPQAVNAIEYAAAFIAYLQQLGQEFAERGTRDPLYDVPHTTVATGLIQGGTATNIVPKDCRFHFEFRNILQDDPDAIGARIESHVREAIEPKMRAVEPSTGIGITLEFDYPGLDTDPDDEIVSLAKTLTGRDAHAKVAYGTEAGIFRQRAGIPAVVCGPGSIVQAHKPDEFIAVEQVARCEAFLRRLLDRAASA